MSGTLTEEDYKKQCKDLVSLSDKIGDGWELMQDRDDVYIVKTVKIPILFREDDRSNLNPISKTNQSQNSTESDNDDMSEDHITLEDDPDTLIIASTSHLITFEYHVTYSCSYTVPVLYFNAWHSTGKLLTADEIWKLAPPCSDKYSYITQIDHPILARPFYELHPCRTEQMMGLVEGGDTYLVSWLSSVGREVGLSVDIRYCRTDSTS